MSKKSGKRMSARNKSVIALAITLVLTLFVGYVALVGIPMDSEGIYSFGPWLPTTNTDEDHWPSLLKLGLDLNGGVFVEYTATNDKPTEVSFDDLLEGTISVIQTRLTENGITEATVQKLGANGIRVEIPTGKNGNSAAAQSTVLDTIGKTALMKFIGPTGDVLFTGEHVQLAQARQNLEAKSADDGWYIAFKLDAEGAKIFGDVTTDIMDGKYGTSKNIKITLDDVTLIDATVQSAITGGEGQITGSYTRETAKATAAQIQSGALPLVLTQDKVDVVDAQLGPKALSSAVLAAVIGIVLVMLIMICRYRLNGLMASWALAIYIIVLFMLIAALPEIQLTLPGLAGIVLGIGMAVDANVIIFERFNEEIRAGRSVKQAVRAGFRNAMSAILDANVTTVIAAVVLLVFGTASVQGFGKTLLLGVLTSFVTAVFVTRFLMNRLVGLGITNTKLFCSKKEVG